jgi:hypothetical protein
MMGNVTQLYDPEGDELIRRAELAGGPANLSEGERWRWQNTIDRRRRNEAHSAPPARPTDALASQRLEAIESQLVELKSFGIETLPQIVGEEIGAAEQRAAADAKKLLDELRDVINAKSDAQFVGFERAVSELRDGDRAAMLATVRKTLTDAESRVDEHLENALQTTWERAELEIALVRDELLNILAEKKYGVFTDDDPKLAERAIAELRKRIALVEEEGARQAARNDQLAGMADRFAALDEAYHKSTKSLLIRCAANHLAAKKERERADELASEVAHLKAEFERLTAALLDQKVIS